MSSNGGTPALDALVEVAQQEAERDGLEVQLRIASDRLSAATDRAAMATDALAGELADVARLEELSLTRILATMRGRRDQDLDRERAEVQSAEYVAAEAESRRRSAQSEVDSIVARLAGFGDLTARRVELLAQREAEVAADPGARATSARLVETATDLGRRAAERVQLEEAIAAGHVAAGSLDQAARHLGAAGDWATFDTFLGGGLLTDMVKYDNLDKAGTLMRQADAALARLASELADVGMSSVGGIEITQLTGFFDVWFDNIFSDWAVRERVRQAKARVVRARAAVEQAGSELGRRLASCDAEIERLQEVRNTLLGA